MAQWGGERALRIAQLQDYLDAANADVDNFRSEIDEYAGYDDLSPEESADLACLISQRAAAEYESHFPIWLCVANFYFLGEPKFPTIFSKPRQCN